MNDVSTNNTPEPRVKEAEEKLKQMSRKAKERKNTKTSSVRQPKGINEINYFRFIIGGVAALGVGYLFLKSREDKKPKYRFVPRRDPVKLGSEPKKPSDSEPEPTSTEPKKEADCSSFELNCF